MSTDAGSDHPGAAAGNAAALGSRTVINTLFVLSARVVSRLVALVVVIVLANHLGASQYGRYTTLVAFSALVSVVADLGLNTLYTREAARDPERLSDFLATLLSGKLVLAVAAAILLAGALAYAGLGDLLAPGAALLILTTYSSLLRNTFYARGRLGLEAVAVVAETVIQSGLILLGARAGAQVAFFVWAYAASYGVTAAYCLAVIPAFGLGRPRIGFDAGLFVRWLRLALPFAIGILLTNLYFRADVPILQHFKPFREVGWYTFAYKPFESLQFIPLAVQTVVYPLLSVYYRTSADRLGRAYEKFFKVLVLLGWPLTVGTFILVHPVGRLFRLFPESEPALRILALGIVFLFINSAFTAMLYSIDRQDLFARATAIAVAVNVGLNLLLIPIYGYLAAAATTVVTEAALAVSMYLYVARSHRLPWLSISWRILASGALMGAALLPVANRAIYVSAAVGVVAYAAGIFLLRAVDREELTLFWQGLRLRRG